ncbi:major facilitator superfamily transporter multidrug resistance [Xylariomycetidae sp. FL0641]|nr:major facilitator superfamily transporter multidrug resistance [Xylariomycetidae sp. FL0641]
MAHESHKLNDLSPDVVGEARDQPSKENITEPSLHDVERESVQAAPEIPPPTHDIPSINKDKTPSPLDIQPVESVSQRTPPVVVPRARRRGLFASFTLIPEVENPRDYPYSTKWMLVAIVAAAGATAPAGSAILYPALPEMAKELDVSLTLINLSIALYMLAMSIFPLWWSAVSESHGRRTIYVVSFTLNVVFNVLSARSPGVAQLLVFRVLSGGASASVQAIGAGTIADCFAPRERGAAMGVFYLGPLAGPLLAPIIGGALAEALGWRSTLYALAIWGGLVLVLIVFGLAETLPRRAPSAAADPSLPSSSSPHDNAGEESAGDGPHPRTRTPTRRAARHVRRWAHLLLVQPFTILRYLRFPAVLLTVYYAAITFGSLYVLNISVQAAFSRPPYAYGQLGVGLLYLPPSAGYFASSMLGGRWSDAIARREARRAGRYDDDDDDATRPGALRLLPEDRLRENAWLAASLFPVALVWYGWSVQCGLPPVSAAFAGFAFGAGSMLVFNAATTMLTEFMPHRASSGVALNNLVRNVLSAVGGVVGQPAIDAIGHGWLMTAVGALAWVSGHVVLVLLRRNAAKWRVKMDEELRKEM